MTITKLKEKKFANDQVNNIEKRIKSMRYSLQQHNRVLREKNWIIQIGGIFITPEFDKNNKTTGTAVNCDPHQAMRFNELDAISLAKKATNGAGKVGKAVLWKEATEEILKELEKLLEMFKSYYIYEG